VLRTRHGAPNHLTPSAAYVERHSERVLVLKMDLVDCLLNAFTANASHSEKSDEEMDSFRDDVFQRIFFIFAGLGV